jgi:ferredoxin
MPWVNTDLCTGCGTCIESCPVGAISIQDHDGAVIDEQECIRCGRCHDICPEEAVRHDSERIPQRVEENMAWASKLLGHFDTETEKAALVERLRKFFTMQMKVIRKTLDRMEALP